MRFRFCGDLDCPGILCLISDLYILLYFIIIKI